MLLLPQMRKCGHYQPTCSIARAGWVTWSSFFFKVGLKALQIDTVHVPGWAMLRSPFKTLCYIKSQPPVMCFYSISQGKTQANGVYKTGREGHSGSVTVVSHLPTPNIKDLFVSLSGNTYTPGDFWLVAPPQFNHCSKRKTQNVSRSRG